MTYVCPRCGAPFDDADKTVIGNWEVTCSFCEWSGISNELLATEKEVADPRVFDVFLSWFSDAMAKDFSKALVDYIPDKCFDGSDAPQKIMGFMNKMASVYVAAVTAAILDPNLIDELPILVPDTRLASLMASRIEKPVVRTLVQLGLLVRTDDARNIRYVTNILRYATRCLQSSIEDEGGYDRAGDTAADKPN